MVHSLAAGELTHQAVATDIEDIILVLSSLQCLYQAWMHSAKYVWQLKQTRIFIDLFVTDALPNARPPNPAEANRI